ncbi:MAG: hypothetical protein LBK62_05250 [Treponema sp.]|nr:hypothetical protein [Treponema sp.]
MEQFREEQLPVAPLPSEREMRRRKLILSHKRAVKLRVQLINLVHGLSQTGTAGCPRLEQWAVLDWNCRLS